jgi:5-hydroxyisourate hydrolase
VTHAHPTISTHVLDTAAGRPASGVAIRLWRLGPGDPAPAGEGVTDEDGRIRDLLDGRPLEVGGYRIEFALDGRFFRRVALEIAVDDATRSYHVPLLVAPYGVSSYRGS